MIHSIQMNTISKISVTHEQMQIAVVRNSSYFCFTAFKFLFKYIGVVECRAQRDEDHIELNEMATSKNIKNLKKGRGLEVSRV